MTPRPLSRPAAPSRAGLAAAFLVALCSLLVALCAFLPSAARADWSGSYNHNQYGGSITFNYFDPSAPTTWSHDDWNTTGPASVAYCYAYTGHIYQAQAYAGTTAYFYWAGTDTPNTDTYVPVVIHSSASAGAVGNAPPDYSHVSIGSEAAASDIQRDRKLTVRVNYGHFPGADRVASGDGPSGDCYWIEVPSPGLAQSLASFNSTGTEDLIVRAAQGVTIAHVDPTTLTFTSGSFDGSGGVSSVIGIVSGSPVTPTIPGGVTIVPILGGVTGNNPTVGGKTFSGPVFTTTGNDGGTVTITNHADGSLTVTASPNAETASADVVVTATYTDPDGYAYSRDYTVHVADADLKIQTEHTLGGPFDPAHYSLAATFNGSPVAGIWTFSTDDADPGDVSLSSGDSASQLDFTKRSYNYVGGSAQYVLNGTFSYTSGGTTYSQPYSL